MFFRACRMLYDMFMYYQYQCKLIAFKNTHAYVDEYDDYEVINSDGSK